MVEVENTVAVVVAVIAAAVAIVVVVVVVVVAVHKAVYQRINCRSHNQFVPSCSGSSVAAAHFPPT